MSHPEYKTIEERLRETGAPPPPADLADRLKGGIPERPSVVRFPGEGDESPPASRTRWLLAASIAVALIGGSIVFLMPLQHAAMSPVLVEGQPGSENADERVIVAEVTGSSGEILEPSSQPIPSPIPREAVGPLASKEAPPPESMVSSVKSSQDLVIEVLPETGLLSPHRLLVEGTNADEAVSTDPASPPVTDRVAPLVMSYAEEAVRMRSAPHGALVVPSTGGTTEPNDLPYGDMFFQSYGVNPFIDTDDDNLSTFGLDVDTASYTMARSYLERGHLPPAEAIRVEEMVNFFDYGDQPPSRGDFAIHAEGAPTPFAEGSRYRLLRFNVRGREIDTSERLPATLIFVVDVSGSMDRENRLGLVKQSLGLLLDQLGADDRVGLVVYGSRGQVLLEPTGDLEAIRAAIGRLHSEGSTNAEEGLVLGYQLADRFFRAGAINRIVLCSDGVANVGRTGPDSILARVGTWAERGIELTTIGFGMGNYNDLLMEQLADRGDGNYAYVDSLNEARRVFVENLTGTLQTIARDAKIQVEFNPEVVSRYRLLGYENRDIADERFRDDTVDAGEIGAGHSVTALYEVKLHEGAKKRAELATLRLRYHSVAAGEVVETAATLRVRDLADSWASSSPALRLASVVAEHAEILRQSFWARGSDLGEVFRRAQGVSAEHAGSVDVAELVSLVGRAWRLTDSAAGEAPEIKD